MAGEEPLRHRSAVPTDHGTRRSCNLGKAAAAGALPSELGPKMSSAVRIPRRLIAIVAVSALVVTAGCLVGTAPAVAAPNFAVAETIGVGNAPYGVAVNTATDRVYVVNSAANTVSVFAGS